MNTNDDFESKRLMEEIEKLENDSSIQVEEEAIKSKNPLVENLVFLGTILVVVLGVLYLYNTKDNSGKLKKVEIYKNEDSVKEIINDDKELYQIDEKYNIDYENYDTDYNIAEKAFAEQKQNIEVSKNIININKELVLCIKNNNKTSIPNVYVYAVFYDGENTIVGIENSMIEVLVGESERYITFFKNPKDYERVETFITKEYFGDSIGTILNDKISYELNDDENGKLEKIEIKNNSDKKVDIVEVTIIYYGTDDNILSVENKSCYDIKKNKKGVINVYGIWDDAIGEYMNYDHYEIQIDSAISYNK